MLQRKIIFTVIAFVVTAILGVIYIARGLPTPPSKSVLDLAYLYFLDFGIVLLGPFVAFWVMDIISTVGWVLIGCFSTISIFAFVYFFISAQQKPWKLIYPTAIWVSIGTYLLFWGLAASI